MNKYLILICPILLMVDSCKKKDTAINTKTTVVEGHLLRKYSGKPLAGYDIELSGDRPHEPCLFCPQYYTDELATTQTDSNGYYKMSVTVPDVYTSMEAIAHQGCGCGKGVVVGSEHNVVDFPGWEYIVVKANITISNNTHPALQIYDVYGLEAYIRARDTSYTAYGYLDANSNYRLFYSYTDSSANTTHYHQDAFTTPGFVDTLTLSFSVDASTF